MRSPKPERRSLRELLEATSLGYAERLRTEYALRQPWCWPLAPALRARAAAHLPSPPDTSGRRGEALLVSATSLKVGYRVGLWRLRPRWLEDASGARPFVDDALKTLQRVQRSVTRDLPVLLSSEWLRQPWEWCADPLFPMEGAEDQTLDGFSYGLSMLLAAASLAMDVPLPTDLVASAQLGEGGAIERVQALDHKIPLVMSSALGVRRMLVAKVQEVEAREEVARAGGGLEVVGIATVPEAFRYVFGDTPDHLFTGTNAGPELQKIAWKLFLLALESRAPILDWKSVERGAELLLAQLKEGEPAHTQADIARQIAQRHAMKSGVLPSPSESFLGGLSRPLRTLLVANVLQSAHDGNDAALATAIERARTDLPRARECYEPQLALRGAVGRALAGMRRYREAQADLRETVEAWLALGKPQEASRPLCELIRVNGILEDAEAFDAAEALGSELLHCPEVTWESRSFLHLALGRACVLLRRPNEALRWLGDGPPVEWSAVRADVRRSRLRWLASAHELAGEPEEAERRRREIGEGLSIEGVLARLDAALARGDDVTRWVDQVLACEGCQGGPRLLQGVSDAREKGTRLAREYPY